MTDYFVVFGDFLASLPTYLLNGVLATVYWLGESGAALVSILCAGLIIRFVDQRVQSRAAFRPGRSGREAATPDLYTAQITTAIILVLWVISQWLIQRTLFTRWQNSQSIKLSSIAHIGIPYRTFHTTKHNVERVGSAANEAWLFDQ